MLTPFTNGFATRTAFVAALAAIACRPQDAARAVTEDAYLAARDSVIRSISPDGRRIGVTGAVVDSASKALESMLKTIVGPFRAKGFSDSARTNVATLYPEMDSGMLDGLRYQASDGRGIIVTTTRSLFERWLGDTRNQRRFPSDPVAALANDDVYYQIFGGGAAFHWFANLPVAEPGKRGVIAARLVRRSQDIGGVTTPDEIVVAVSRGTRIFFGLIPTTATLPEARACKTSRDSAGLGDAADAQYRRCYAEAITRDSVFSVVVTQASRFVSSLPMR